MRPFRSLSGERRDVLSRAVYPTRFFKMLQMAIWRAHGGSEKYPAARLELPGLVAALAHVD